MQTGRSLLPEISLFTINITLNMFKEFKEFAVKGNVMDMAIGIIIGAAFGKIVSSFVADVIMPPIAVLLSGIDLSGFAVTLKQATDTTPAITLNYGLFMNTVIDFLIIAFAIFLVVKQINKLKKKEQAKPVQPSEDTLLLREIRDLLKK
ncbi:MAG: Large-conductance mechanosensitive channel [Parcubacteria group bacterium ADurb.Bin192]|nr:MAG: Large-conductance mechanosensitive channel [Parcubacteria group bacterium ADurb.Bin192]